MAAGASDRDAEAAPILPGSGREGSNPCTLQSGYWLVGIVDWPDRAGLPGVARESQCFEIAGRRTVVLGATSPENDAPGAFGRWAYGKSA